MNPNWTHACASMVVLAALGGLVSCARPALSTHETENPHISYERLFSREGCEIGRFIDYGRPVYVTLCPKMGVSASQSSWVENCGKNCWKTVDRHQVQLQAEPPLATLREPATPAR